MESEIATQLHKLVNSLRPEDRNATLSALIRIFDQITQYPSNDEHRQIKLTDKTFTVWQYPSGQKLMKMSGWVVEDDHLRLRDDSRVEIMLQLLKSFLSSSAIDIIPFPDDEFQILIKAFYDGNIPCIQKLLKVSHISSNGRVYSESGSTLNLLYSATIAQQMDVVKLLMTDYSVGPYYLTLRNNKPMSYFKSIFHCAPQSFIIAILKHCGVNENFKTTEGISLLHYAVIVNCFVVVSFLLEGCNDINVNVTTDVSSRTPLHFAYLYGQPLIAQYLIQHGADVFAVDIDGCTPYEYIDGDPDRIKYSEYLQSKRKIHEIPFSIKHCYFMKLKNNEIDDKNAVICTMEQFPSLKEDGPTPAHHYSSALKEFTQFITNDTQRSADNSSMLLPSEVQEECIKASTDYPWMQLCKLKRENILF